MRIPSPLSVDESDLGVLCEWSSSPGAVARRARIVLLAAEGRSAIDIAALVGCSRQTVITWRERYRSEGIAGLQDCPRSGRPVSVDDAVVVERTMEVSPHGSRWSTRSLGAELGISNGTVAAIWRAWGISPRGAGAIRLISEPPIEERIERLVGLLVAPPVRLLALTTGGTAAGTGRPLRVGLLSRLDALERVVREVGPGRVGIGSFLEAVAGRGRTRLVVAGSADRAVAGVRARTAGRAGVDVHLAPPSAWPRMAQVVAALAGTTPAGADAVADLVRRLDAHLADGSGEPFAWSDRKVLPG
jgi:transposase